MFDCIRISGVQHVIWAKQTERQWLWMWVNLWIRTSSMDTDASVDQNSARKQLLNFSAACQRTPHTCVGPPSASVRSYILNKFPTNSSTSMVLASVWRKNSVSWATKCISSLKMVCKRVALSNSRRGNFEGNRTNRSTYREMDNFERSYDNCQLSGSDRSC